MEIWCCGCECTVVARLTNGAELYPSRRDLADLPRWVCDTCGNSVGTHHRSNTPTKPLGCIPTREIAKGRAELHNRMDVLWRFGGMKRGEIYRWIGGTLGRQFHVGELRTLDEIEVVRNALRRLEEIASKVRENKVFRTPVDELSRR